MPSKPKPAKVPSWLDIFKSQRGEPIPPKRVIPMERRPGATEADFEDDGLEVCIFCGQVRDPRENALRCGDCVEEDGEVLEELLYPEDVHDHYDLGGEG